jgi:pimeloyl-ACP methyl ester carboxylesterase/predicted glycosyltransferase
MLPDREGYIKRDGVKLWYEVYGDDHERPTILLMPTWAIFHSRHWKMQIPFLARRYRVVTFDGRGNGRSDRPADDAAYSDLDYVADAVAVLDATDSDTCFVAGVSQGGLFTVLLASEHPDRVRGVVVIGASVPLGEPNPEKRALIRWNERIDNPQGWEKHNRFHWLSDYADWAEFFVRTIFSEPHSTKPFEDGLGWALETDGATLIRTNLSEPVGRDAFRERLERFSTPLLAIHGDDDRIISHEKGQLLADATGGELLTLEGSGHAPMARDPVQINLAIEDFVDRLAGVRRPTRRWARGRARRKRALYVSSPIGLGHARRDVAIADAMRELHPDLEIDWLAQSPVTRVLEAKGERIHPASRWASSEVAHIDRESGEHRLHAFQAIRRMDEILHANFMIFHDVMRERHYDLVIGDEAWEIDYYLHENPELKRSAYVWLTDFVGWLPMASGGEREAFLTADYNAEMIGHIARYPRIRDRAIFVGDPDDIVPDTFGPDLPRIRDWTEAHFDFAGYIPGFDPAALPERAALRAELGYAADEQVCIVSVGGSGVGLPLLRRIADAFPTVRRALPGLRMVMVAGPRIDPEEIPAHEGLEVRRYVDRLFRHLAVCDLAVVQGGLTTCMELTAAGVPFLYVPLRDHFEQNHHVRARLERYGAGRRLAYDAITPETLAAAMVEELGREVAYRPVEAGGAARAAALIAEVL